MNPKSTFQFPEMAAIRQRLYSAPIAHVPDAVSKALSTISFADRTNAGDTVAVAVGSRGIDRALGYPVALGEAKRCGHRDKT